MDPIQKLHRLGQSLWYDNIQRRLLENGELKQLIDRGEIRGVTSNPSIFHNAIARSSDYDSALKPMAWSGWPAEKIFYQLAIEDIQTAADLFEPLYRQTNGADGYVSLEVSPYLANDAQKTFEEAKQLWQRVNRPNLMVKIPATLAGIDAIRQATAEGINVNVTLIFSIARYLEVMNAYLTGLENRLAKGETIDRIASVASFFVSRVDSKVDGKLQQIIKAEGEDAGKASQLLGKAAIANARLAYAEFLRVFGEERFKKLQSQGARKQRPLWASTSTKNPTYRDVIYVEELIGPDTVNTVPPQTLDAFRDHGNAQVTLDSELDIASAAFGALQQVGVSIDRVTQELEEEGIKAFADAFTALIQTIEERRLAAVAELGELASPVQERIRKLEDIHAVERFTEADASLWVDDPAQQAEIRKRLGWQTLPTDSLALLPELTSLRQEVSRAGYTHALLLGMGGSSLAPEVMRSIFGTKDWENIPPLDLAILDSTDPNEVEAVTRRASVERTLYIVASKSGTTSEVNAFLDYFWARAQRKLGERAGEHFIAITDPGTKLDQLASERGFRRVLRSDPNTGGRYSALTLFGLTAAALIGMDVKHLLLKAEQMASLTRPGKPYGRNPGLVLGAIMGEAALRGRDKLTLIADAEVCAFGSWLEQLIAESSGKEGRGIIPVDMEPYARNYSKDRLFVYLRSDGKHDRLVQRIIKAGQPALTLPMDNAYDLGSAFYLWEFATAIATAILRVNGFDQPDVQDNKTRTTAEIDQFRKLGRLDEGEPLWENNQAKVFGSDLNQFAGADSLREVIQRFLSQAEEGDYIAINAYLPRNRNTISKLQSLRKTIQAQTGLATTLGFGPRFLHSTGQLHKGGPSKGLFLQITRELNDDLPIPGAGISFGLLQRAQALGDLEALLARGRRAIRIHLTDGGLEDLAGS